MRLKSELKRKLRKELGVRLGQLRGTLELSRNKIAEKLKVNRTSFQRNEAGGAIPELSTLFKLSETFNVSMDWLLFNKGPMFYKDKLAEEQKKGSDSGQDHNCMDALPKDYRELLECMDKLPILRYEILLQFRKFLKDNNELSDHTAPLEEQT